MSQKIGISNVIDETGLIILETYLCIESVV